MATVPPRPALTSDAPRTNLRPDLTSFLGREALIAAMDADVARGARLVTLTGAAGMGKTRVAREWARHHTGVSPSPPACWFCDLSSATSQEAVVAGIATSIEPSLEPEMTAADTVSRLCRGLARRGPTLLVLDNLEQALEPAVEVITAILERCAEVRVVATSRTRLKLRGERAHEVEPLDDETAMDLFLERARAAGGGEALAGDREEVRAIVRGLDGIPLALELTAAWIHVLGPRELQRRLRDHVALMGPAFRDAPRRHRTLSAAVAWSWELLSPVQRSVLLQLSQFVCGCDLDAVEAIVAVPAGSAHVFELLAELCDSSLVFVHRLPGEGQRLRYRLLAPIASYVEAQLGAAELSVTDLHVRHAEYYLRLAEALVARAARGEERQALARLTLERANVAVGHRRLRETKPALAARLALVGQPYWVTLGPDESAAELLDSAVDCAQRADDPRLLARALWHRGADRCKHGRVELGRSDLEAARTLAVRAGDRELEHMAILDLGQRAIVDSAPGPMVPALRAVLRSAEMNDALSLKAKMVLGGALADLGELVEARELLAGAVETARSCGRYHEIVAHAWLAGVELEAQRPEVATYHAEQAYALSAQRPRDTVTLHAWLTRGSLRLLLGERDLGVSDLEDASRAALTDGNRAMHGYAELWLAVACLQVRDLPGARASLERAAANIEPGVSRGRAAVAVVSRAVRAAAGGPPEPESELTSQLVRAVQRGLAAVPAGSTPDAPELTIAANGTWFRRRGEARVDLDGRRHLPAVLAVLARSRATRPGAGVTSSELYDAGWPGASLADGSGINRVYVAVSTLRQLGLSEHLIRGRDGYLLNQALDIVVES